MGAISILFLFSSGVFINSVNTINHGEGSYYAHYHNINYMATLRTSDNIRQHMCAGSIYYARWILTARSCLLHPHTMRAHMITAIPAFSRRMTLNNYRKDYPMEKSFCHPFSKGQPDVHTDIGLIKLREPINLKPNPTDNDVIKVKLLREDFNFSGHYDRQNVFVSGWGEMSPFFGFRDWVRQGNYQLKQPSVCEQDPLSINFKHPNHICLRCRTEWVAPCYGDEGGPALYHAIPEWALIGVIPAMRRDCHWHPFVVNISHFREFIDKVVRHEPAEYECKRIKVENEKAKAV
ncbi:mast cell protease 2-like [Brevipalpus obovatus]|uniref:mast cell protease 2-like n=1 Tax=Brevipalpus obovatus TaxID=246614 RepID=UPI003D9DF163